MTHYDQQFSIEFNFPVYFTQTVFAPTNDTFLAAIRRLEPDRCHRILFVVDSNVASKHPAIVDQIEAYAGTHSDHLQLVARPLIVTGGESSKSGWSNVLEILEHLNVCGMDRQSFVTVIGGGALLDMVCFAAAIAHRGIRTIRIPTTVLAQADSGVGVKNGINLFGKKNFIGTFQPPFAVINDSSFILTLDRRDKIAGLAEAVKVSLLRDPVLFGYLEQNAQALSQADPTALQYVIRRSAELHLKHIRESGDPFEAGSARPLDFGHWSAHKLESLTNHALRHGEAVAIGMAIDVIYSARKGHLSQSTADRILRLLEAIGLELWSEALLDENDFGDYAILTGIQEFREHLGGRLHITLLRDLGQPFEVHEIDDDAVLRAIAVLRQRAVASEDCLTLTRRFAPPSP